MKRVRILAAVFLVVVFLLPALVSAQGSGIVYRSGFQVQNLENAEATIVIEYYNQDGTKATTVDDTIPALGSKTYFPIHPDEGFNGSVVISSDRQIAAIANLLAEGAVNAGSASIGFSAGATAVNLPLIMRGNAGFDTFFNVQNAGSATTHVTVTYYPGSAGNAGVTEEWDIPPGAAHTFDQATNAALGDLFIGSARVESDGQPVVATVEQVGSGNIKTLLGYNGFTAGSSTVVAPLIQANNAGFFSGIQVQNVGTTTASVTVTYGPNVAGSFAPAPESAAVEPGASHTFIQLGGQWTQTYVGSATITNAEGQPLVAIVNQLKMGALSFGSAYEGFDPAAATSTASAPLVMANNYGYFTGIQVQNVGGADPCEVTVTYSPNTVGAWSPAPESASIPAGASNTFLQLGGQWSERYVGSATITGAGCNIVAIVNELNLSLNDQFFTYTAINYTP